MAHQPSAAEVRRWLVVGSSVSNIPGKMNAPKLSQSKQLTPEAERALAEAAARRSETQHLPPEQGGVRGPEPTRYGDWEHKGLATDF
jgi:hypothetical protein